MEAGAYPRHRVCGEFISGEGQNSLTRLGLLDGLPTMGTCSAKSVAFFVGADDGRSAPTAGSALCISRFELDQWLARQFLRLGGELRQGERWCGEFGTGIVRASGRRAEPLTDGWRLFGLKAHARGVSLEADLRCTLCPRLCGFV